MRDGSAGVVDFFEETNIKIRVKGDGERKKEIKIESKRKGEIKT